MPHLWSPALMLGEPWALAPKPYRTSGSPSPPCPLAAARPPCATPDPVLAQARAVVPDPHP